MTCPRCRITLPGRVTHDTAEECVSTLRSRLTMEQGRAKTACRKLDNATARAEEWKAKALAVRVDQTHGAMTTAHRLASLEADQELAARKIRELTELTGKLQQESRFLMTQVSALQGRADLRRAS